MSQSEKKSIKRIDGITAKSISSGQVITSLSNVVKELIENSIDAKSTHISLKFKDFGKESIECADNGFGVEESDFESIAKRHYTSKLSDFSQLSTIQTFGFRGEALSSLCDLSKVSIHSRHLSQSIGTKLYFNSEGIVIRRELSPRNIGTTVTVENLFHNIPVRRKEFVNNIKREFDKMLRLVYSYCIGCVGIRISCTNQLVNKTKQTIFSSPGISIKNNIVQIFDSKQLNSLVEFEQYIESDEQLANDNNNNNSIKITGFISKCDFGCGRSANDRQFLYVNRRPCELKNILKFINEMYRNFNRNQYPFVLLNIEIDKSLVDFNVTPDKRQLIISKEEQIFSIIKESLIKMYNKEDSCQLDSMTNYTTKLFHNLSQKRKSESVDAEVNAIMSTPLKMSRCRSPCDSPFKESVKNERQIVSPNVSRNKDFELCDTSRDKPLQSFTTAFNVLNRTKSPENNSNNLIECRTESTTSPINIASLSEQLNVIEPQIIPSEQQNEPNDTSNISHTNECRTEFQIIVESDEDEVINEQNQQILSVDLETIRKNFLKAMTITNTTNSSQFTAKIRPSQNETAEQELNHELKKSSFKDMKIIGQFNLGFIIAKLNCNLFIVDQHASNERYNYENFLSNTVINNQNLVCPLPLELSAANELIVIDNLMTFKSIGFGIAVDNSAPSGRKLHLSSLPVSKEWTAGKDDIEEIIGAIIETPLKLLTDFKLSGLKKVIASRACRSSFMIGEPLNFSQMKLIVSQMSELKNPWHCAHHRPTIRHLLNLNNISEIIN
jgi:DNA mismatch repair protein PMS2